MPCNVLCGQLLRCWARDKFVVCFLDDLHFQGTHGQQNRWQLKDDDLCVIFFCLNKNIIYYSLAQTYAHTFWLVDKLLSLHLSQRGLHPSLCGRVGRRRAVSDPPPLSSVSRTFTARFFVRFIRSCPARIRPPPGNHVRASILWANGGSRPAPSLRQWAVVYPPPASQSCGLPTLSSQARGTGASPEERGREGGTAGGREGGTLPSPRRAGPPLGNRRVTIGPPLLGPSLEPSLEPPLGHRWATAGPPLGHHRIVVFAARWSHVWS